MRRRAAVRFSKAVCLSAGVMTTLMDRATPTRDGVKSSPRNGAALVVQR
jgi:hypothetical protein